MGGYSAHLLFANGVPDGWLTLAALTALTGSITVKIPSVPGTLSVSDVFVFVAVLLFGKAGGTVLAALDGLVISLWLFRKEHSFTRLVFNTASPATALWLSACLFELVQPSQPLTLKNLILPLVALASAYFLLNTWIVAVAIALDQRRSAWKIWSENFLWLSPNFFSGASVAALLVAYTKPLDPAALWIVIPILVISFLTYKTAMGRVEDANRHVAQLNRLYLSTIETLAMAIDAKDQITHGHIRRVQQYAVALAKALGVRSESELRAIEAAALLHDMGKLAVPDYILNKPGPLTAAEREKIKLHAIVGADILSAIDFPYPVVPIVRHHHEAWDGSGYPAGLKGTEIPIGARVLAVVDCFDALTTDRPYRPRLSEAAALQVIRGRRGSLYDPVVVDAFIKVHAELSLPEPPPAATGGGALEAIARAASASVVAEPTERLEEIAASSDEMLTLLDISRGLAASLNLEDAADLVARHLRRLVPSTACVFYLYDQDTDVLVAAHAPGDTTGAFSGLRIPLGQRLTGWVAANRQTVVNSDPVLDLGETARALQPPLRSAISTPLVARGTLVGALTLYSAHRNAFTEDHRRILEAVAGQVAQIMKAARDAERERTRRLRNELTGLPDAGRFSQFARALADAEGNLEAPCSILLVALHGLEQLTTQEAGVAKQRLLADIAAAARRALRAADVLFHYREDQFLIVLPRADDSVARAVAQRAESAIERALAGAVSRGLRVSVTTGLASVPADGTNVETLVSHASQRAMRSAALDDGRFAEGRRVH